MKTFPWFPEWVIPNDGKPLWLRLEPFTNRMAVERWDEALGKPSAGLNQVASTPGELGVIFAVVAEADVTPQGPGKFPATAFLLTALVLICLVLCPALFGSGSSGGGEVITRSDPDELRAAKDEPATPTVAPPGPWDLGGRDCPAPPGRIGPHSALSAANSGHPECQAHHIIQDRAVRDVPGYSYGRAPAIVLATTQHALATYYQNHAP